MRTKTLLIAAAAIAAGVISSQAQSSNVYSANIVGYVNVPVQGGNALTLIANPLVPANGDYNITNTVTGLPDEADTASIYKWDGTAWANDVPGWIAGFGWFPDVTIGQGEAFFIQSPVAFTLTFVGEVALGTNVTTFDTGLNMVANKVPVNAPWPGSTVGNDTDAIYLWTGSAWDNTVWGYIQDYGWYGSGDPLESVDGPALAPGTGVFYQNTGVSPLTWTNVFTVQ